jgi:hypothetical protein
MIITISIDGKKLIAGATGQTATELRKTGTDEFELLIAVRDENKKVINFDLNQNGKAMKAKKIN